MCMEIDVKPQFGASRRLVSVEGGHADPAPASSSRDAHEPRQFERDVVTVPDEVEIKRRPDRRPARNARPRAGGGDRLDLGALPAEIGDRLVALADEPYDLGERRYEDDAQEASADAYL